MRRRKVYESCPYCHRRVWTGRFAEDRNKASNNDTPALNSVVDDSRPRSDRKARAVAVGKAIQKQPGVLHSPFPLSDRQARRFRRKWMRSNRAPWFARLRARIFGRSRLSDFGRHSEGAQL